jgi:polar amino acid transport system substrate-binding protein
MARSLAAVVDGNADLHLPLLRPPHPEAIPFDVTAARMWEVPFVIYTNKDKPLDAAALHEGTYKLETEVAHVGYFDFPVNGSAGFESSLRKVDAGRIDGFIFAANIIDPVVQTLGLSHIHRAFYRNFDAVGVVRKDAAGAAANRWFSAAIAAVQTDPAFLAVQHKIVGGYRGPDWQFVSK